MALKVGAVSAADFAQYVAIHHNNNDQRFTEEFEVFYGCEFITSRPLALLLHLPMSFGWY